MIAPAIAADPESTVEDLEEARVWCWTCLDIHGTRPSEKKEHCRLRAVICGLYPTKDPDERLDALVFFVEMMLRTGNFRTQLRQAIHTHLLT